MRYFPSIFASSAFEDVYIHDAFKLNVLNCGS